MESDDKKGFTCFRPDNEYGGLILARKAAIVVVSLAAGSPFLPCFALS
jgi:hypothetical protein